MRAPAHHPLLAGARDRSKPTGIDWLAGPCARIADRFAAMADADAVSDAARTLFAQPLWAETLLAPLVAALHADPWFEPPLKVSRDPLRTGVVLIDCPQVTITATITRADTLRALPPARTVVISGRHSVTHYIRGGDAVLQRWRADAVDGNFSGASAAPCRMRDIIPLGDGLILTQDGRTDGHLIIAAQRAVVAVTATIKVGAAPLMREYAIDDGRFLRTASADDRASRIEMLLTFLRVSGRADAADAYDTGTRHPAFHLRWAAMREWLMLDARAARPRLVELALNDPHGDVRAAARATLAALDRRLAEPCPA